MAAAPPGQGLGRPHPGATTDLLQASLVREYPSREDLGLVFRPLFYWSWAASWLTSQETTRSLLCRLWGSLSVTFMWADLVLTGPEGGAEEELGDSGCSLVTSWGTVSFQV